MILVRISFADVPDLLVLHGRKLGKGDGRDACAFLGQIKGRKFSQPDLRRITSLDHHLAGDTLGCGWAICRQQIDAAGVFDEPGAPAILMRLKVGCRIGGNHHDVGFIVLRGGLGGQRIVILRHFVKERVGVSFGIEEGGEELDPLGVAQWGGFGGIQHTHCWDARRGKGAMIIVAIDAVGKDHPWLQGDKNLGAHLLAILLHRPRGYPRHN